MKLQELYNEEQKLLDKLRNTTDPRKQKLIKTRISWINTMIEKLEEKEKEKVGDFLIFVYQIENKEG